MPSIKFSRDKSKVVKEENTYHTYSPVNIHNPDLKKHPKFAKARKYTCVVNAGETLFVPRWVVHWRKGRE